MSEEKKPTDEEIAKAILQQIEYNAGIPYINEWQQVKTIKFTDILDFINRLQKTIKYKTDCYNELCNMNNDMACEISEQKDKIERLKINLANEKKWGKIQAKKTEKETAREIWDDCIDKIMRGCGDDKEFWVVEILSETFKKYEVGFEVDYEN